MAFLVHAIANSNCHNNHHQPQQQQRFFASAQLQPDDPEEQDYYCGWNWEEANAGCAHHCPSGLDADCPPLPNGRPRRCIAAAGCYARFRKVYWTGVISLSFDREEHFANIAATSVLGYMTDEEEGAFEESFRRRLLEALDDEKMQISVSVEDQEYDRPCVSVLSGLDATYATSLDMTVSVVGEYIPTEDVSFTDETFGSRVLASVDADPQSFVNAIRNDANDSPSSSSFFDALGGISGIEEDELGESPSSAPSAPPSRGFDQSLDVRIDPRASGSYGIVFNVRTARCGQHPDQKTCGTVLLTGMSFVTNWEGRLEYMVYSKVGPYQKFVGRDVFWDLIASGQTYGRGSKEYTRVLEEDTTVDVGGNVELSYIGFKPVHVPGDRSQRSFYVTVTKKFAKDDGSPIPVSFSFPQNGESEGTREFEVVAGNEEIDVYEGEGVLDYPWRPNGDGPYYVKPRGFIGSFDYERYPCHPLLNFTGWPCPYVRRTGRPTAKPTTVPTNRLATGSPTRNPTNATDANGATTTPVSQTNQTNNQTGTDAPELASPGPETDVSNNATLAVGEQEREEETSNGVMISWKVAYRSVGWGVAAMVLLQVFRLD